MIIRDNKVSVGWSSSSCESVFGTPYQTAILRSRPPDTSTQCLTSANYVHSVYVPSIFIQRGYGCWGQQRFPNYPFGQFLNAIENRISPIPASALAIKCLPQIDSGGSTLMPQAESRHSHDAPHHHDLCLPKSSVELLTMDGSWTNGCCLHKRLKSDLVPLIIEPPP